MVDMLVIALMVDGNSPGSGEKDVLYTNFCGRVVGHSCETSMIKSFVNAVTNLRDIGVICGSVRCALNK
jgi:hypothetical protein